LKNNLKYLVPAAAVTTLFLVGCGDDDVVEAAAADYPCEGTTDNEALLGGSWKLLRKMVALSQTHFSQMKMEINIPIR